MLDALQRPMRDLRISVTDRCNLRCRYCMPREVFGPDHAFLPRGELLSFEEIARVAALSAGHGVDRIRLTGGEPLLRRELPRLVEMLAAVPGIEEVSLTTNGLLLARAAAALAAAGLDRVTVSLDALSPETLREVADAPLDAARVLAGIDAALAAGLDPVKVNMVVRRGLNDGEVPAMAERFRGSGCVLRFIEYMDVGTTNGWVSEDVVPAAEILDLIGSRWPLEPLAPTRSGEVASRYRYRDGGGEIGLIHAVTVPFCHGCTRARLSADGKLFTCLFAAEGRDLRAPLRAGGTDQELSELIAGAWSGRRDRYSAERAARHGSVPGPIEMSYIGG
jgi:cyclic pyranopterin phosphate synthase